MSASVIDRPAICKESTCRRRSRNSRSEFVKGPLLGTAVRQARILVDRSRSPVMPSASHDPRVRHLRSTKGRQHQTMSVRFSSRRCLDG